MTKGRCDPLSVAQLAQVARKAMDNALDLIDDAELLLAAGRFPRALALAILAGEEFGKFMMAQSVVGDLPGDDTLWREFWRRFTNHTEKAGNATGWAATLADDQDFRRAYFENIEQHVEADQDAKFAGLYVDVRFDGTVVAPSEVIDRELAAGAIEVLARVIRMYDDALPDDLVAHYDVLQRGAQRMKDALRTRDPATIARVWDETTSDRGELGGQPHDAT